MATIADRSDFSLELEFTRIYRENAGVHPALREARCLAWQLPRIVLDIEEDDLVPGGCHYGAVGFSSQIGGFLYYSHEEKIDEEIEKNLNRPDYCRKLREMKEFWKKEDCKTRLRQRYSESQLLALPTDDWEGEKAVAYPLYRIAGGILDFKKLLTLGLPGLYALIEEKKQSAVSGGGADLVYAGMLLCLDTLREVIGLYRKRAGERAKEISGRERTPENEAAFRRMKAVEGAMDSILTRRPAHLLEAVELFWMYVLVSEVRNYGRIDDYLGTFYADDIDSGYLTGEQADGIVRKLWERMAKRRTITDGRVFVGGRGRQDEAKADRFAKACIQATRKLKNPDPQLSLRFYKGMDPELLDLAYDAIGEGCTYPVLYNDDCIVRDVCHAFGLPEETAVSYVPYGCGEYVIDHQSFGTPSGVINLMKGLELFLDAVTESGSPDAEYLQGEAGKERMERLKEAAGLSRTAKDYRSFEDFYGDYRKWIAFHIEALAQQEKMEYDFAGEVCGLSWLSMLYDDCIDRGRGLFSGGIRYLGGTMESYGNVNAADSLTAIKKLVFEEGKTDLNALTEALKADFGGDPLLWKQAKRCPKFGNDEEEPDGMLRSLHRFVCNTAAAQAKKVGLDTYLTVVINNSANTTLGLLTGAGADGRRAYTAMANANSPQAGADTKGVTAVLNSMLKADTDIHAGAVQNVKFSKDTFQNHRDAARGAMESYFDRGGAQLMVTVVGRQDLENAMERPQDYTGLLVRVGGFSARFVELSPEVQKDILSRTCY